MTKEPPTTRRTGTHERVDLPIAGHVLSRCCIDWAITLEFLDGFPETRIRIGGLFSLREGATELTINPEDPLSAGKSVVVVRKKAAGGVALGDGTLNLEFTDGMQLVVPPRPAYEAWELSASNGLRLVSMPSGGLAVWDPLS